MDLSPSRRLLALLAVAFLVVSGCSSSDDDAGDTPAPTTAADSGDGNGTDDTTSDDTGAGTDDTASDPLERYADYESVNYDDPDHWVCRPDRTDICDEDLSSTAVDADGTLTVEDFEIADEPAIDCFYVYPTISRDETPFSDWDASDEEEGWVTVNQAARLQSQCRVFAPVYRQRTLSALAAGIGGGEAPEGEQIDPFADVLDAFRTYMAQDNEGRGFVLIGHSQGAAMLNQLIAEEIDGHDDVREKLVSAYLVGWNMAVPEGEDVGGDFDNVPLCRSADQTGCAVSWVTFRSTAPPVEGSFFGGPRSGSSRDVDTSAETDLVAACTNPAALDGGSTELDAYFPTSGGSILAGGEADGGAFWVDDGGIDTPYVKVPGLLTGECTESDGLNYLSVTVDDDPSDPRADDIPGDLTPEWGLHLVDINVVMGDVVALVEQQIASYQG